MGGRNFQKEAINFSKRLRGGQNRKLGWKCFKKDTKKSAFITTASICT